MTSTPPPPARLRTPPTPLHGPKYDSYEPYSPRHSSRISSKNHSFQENMGSVGGGSRTQTTKLPSKKPTFKRTSSQTFSPPSSPISPQQDHRPSRLHGARQSIYGPTMDNDTSSVLEPPKGRNAGAHGIPTPAKTPRKRAAFDDSQIKSTARVLFPGRSINDEGVAPSPRKSRKNKHSGFTLDSFDDQDTSNQFQIYTDSKERVPETSNEELDNPFTKRSPRGQRPAPETRRNGTKHGMTKEIDEAVERGEGMVYVFRGKKFFRAFVDPEEVDVAADDQDELGDTVRGDYQLKHAAGPAAHRPLSRRSIKPRRLFGSAEASPARGQNVEDIDEEALTDIDPDPAHTSASRRETEVTTPTKQMFDHSGHLSHAPATPPTTVKKTKHARFEVMPDEVDEADMMQLDGTRDRKEARKSRPTPFDGWRLAKPGVGGKRQRDAEATASGGASSGKRSRSGQQHGVQ